jgi:hypothetical protein
MLLVGRRWKFGGGFLAVSPTDLSRPRIDEVSVSGDFVSSEPRPAWSVSS